MQPQTETGTRGADGHERGFFGSLFDLSFRHLITGRVVSVLYAISLAFAVLNALFSAGYLSVLAGAFLSAVSDSPALGWIVGVLLFLFATPLLLFVSVVYVRVVLEIVVVLFRIADNTAEAAHRLGSLPTGSPREEAYESA
jgi:hypothetical protein